MKSNISSTNMATGKYITKRAPHTLVQIQDNTGAAIPEVRTFGYSGLIVMYSPKGPTNQFINVEGDDVLTKYDKLFGKGNTNLYGPMATYARRFLEAGFNLNVMNVAPPDAMHANMHVSFAIQQVKTGTLQTPKTITVYAHHNPDTDEYTFSLDRTTLPTDANEIKEVLIPLIQFGFVSKFISDVNSTYDPKEFLGSTDVRLTLPTDGDITKLDINIPVFGLFYEGATDYGNNFSMEISDTNVLINNRYPLYKSTILDKDAKEFEFNFALFNITLDNLSTSFEDTANKTCKMQFTKNNALRLFRPFLVKRKVANQAKKLVSDALDMIAASFISKIKLAFPGFDETTSTSNVMELIEPTLAYKMYYQTQNNEVGRTLETPFSVTTPWTEIDTTDTLIKHSTVPRKLVFEGGSSGKLKEILDNEEFNWDIKYTQSEEPIFTKMFMDAYSGKTDRSIFDQALVKDSLLVGPGFPLKVQEVMEELCRYKEDIIYCDKTRPDFTYWRTPHESVIDFNSVLNWVESWSKLIPNGRNTNCKPIVGRGAFEDPTTGGQNIFDLIYNYFGSNSSLAAWLKSGSPNSFASDSWSDITEMVPGTEELIPDDTQRETLASKDINYYVKKSDKTLSLGEDTAMWLDHESILKNIATSLHFNRILNIVTLIARDRPIIDPSKENIDAIKRKMLEAAKIPAKHFGNTLTVNAFISTHEMEQGRNVVVYEVGVEKGRFSKYNKVIMNANLPSTN